ncbi:cyclopropane-fatty-acyl-phospholipid synthase [Streptomyces niveiscabiei]|uniref:cyclopropane-fatty-acyl-phospholipid synthase family protein n=1 Tax=Streptomyces niveiscabiei TaxID=164115 RepID=UPI0029AE7226|nr:cyclopropane-fatty-acyl-phospholipid synthase family protein [Streptomyces niveiscabiei]MDX3386422.1 cyclopropane-fatty-acyl-phospholipid synthase [Streptomyces niveiscabiei]
MSTLARPGAAQLLAALVEDALDGPLPLRLRAWDGSETGPADAPVVVVRSRRALRRLLWQPGELGLAQAYVTGELDVEGDLAEGLRTMWAAQRERGPRPPRPTSTDRAAISHHYDLSNDFYGLLLDETMTCSCGYWASDEPGLTAADAQRAKLELICRKLPLEPRARLLDIGCGWGSLVLHAAERHGVQVTAATLAREQAAYVRGQVRERGLTERVEVVCQDYRDIQGSGYDAVATVEMGEHVGDAEYPAFIEAYNAPDTHMRPLGETVTLLEEAGLEVRHTESLREHYARTVAAWHHTLEERWDAFVRLAGEETARVWRPYPVGAAGMPSTSSAGYEDL